MLPIDTWLAAMRVESHPPTRRSLPNQLVVAACLLRGAVGRALIALGQAVAGREATAPRPFSVGR